MSVNHSLVDSACESIIGGAKAPRLSGLGYQGGSSSHVGGSNINQLGLFNTANIGSTGFSIFSIGMLNIYL
jgi:hypothetical protein